MQIAHSPGAGLAALRRAAAALVNAAASGEPHEADLGLGVRVVEILEQLERSLVRK